MRIRSIFANNVEPVKKFEVENLSDLVVIAGANGVGKTRLISSILSHLQNPGLANVKFHIESTTDSEMDTWGKRLLDTNDVSDIQKFNQTVQKNRKRQNFKSSILYYESDRKIANVNALKFSWDIPDPDEEQIGWNTTFVGLSGRFQDTQHAIFKKIHNQRNNIALKAQNLMKNGETKMDLNFKDPLEPFRDAFLKLLGPKKLEDVDVRKQVIHYIENEQVRDIKTLSSGESEVVKIVFDFILRNPSDCIIFFDEPELHLHPELSYKLINTLRGIGSNNQFILCTHSPDIISSSIDDSVIFITPPKPNNGNQAIVIGKDDQTNQALKQLGHSVGVVSLGKRIVLIEGKDASLDKKTYSAILKNRFPELVLVPCQGKQSLMSFDTLMTNVLENTIWGVDFFMLCDRDAPTFSSVLEDSPTVKLKFLTKYHLENFFLNEFLIAESLAPLEDEGSWLACPIKIRAELKSIAKEMIPYAVALSTAKYFRNRTGNIDLMTKGVHKTSLDELIVLIGNKSVEERNRMESAIDVNSVTEYVKNVYEQYEKSLEADDDFWKDNIPGKQLLSRFCSKANMSEGRFKNLFLKTSEKLEHDVFNEIKMIFSGFVNH